MPNTEAETTLERCRNLNYFTPEQNEVINQIIDDTVMRLAPLLAGYFREHPTLMKSRCTKGYSDELGRIIAIRLSMQAEMYAALTR